MKQKTLPWRLKLAVDPRTQASRALDQTLEDSLKPGHDFKLFEDARDGSQREIDAEGFKVVDWMPEQKKAKIVDPDGRMHAVPIMDLGMPNAGDYYWRLNWASRVMDPAGDVSAKARDTLLDLSVMAPEDSFSLLAIPADNFPKERSVVQYQLASEAQSRSLRKLKITGEDSIILSSLISGEPRLNEKPCGDDLKFVGEDPKKLSVFPMRVSAAGGDKLTVGAILVSSDKGKLSDLLVREAVYRADELAKLLILERDRSIDFITGALSRKTFIDRATEEVERNIRSPGSLAYAFCDMDHFKDLRTAFGQQVGGESFRQFVSLASSVLEGAGFIGTTGGDEFSVLMTSLDKDEAVRRMKALIADVCNHRFVVTLPPEPAGKPSAELHEAEKISHPRRVKGRRGEADKIILPSGSLVDSLEDGTRIITLPEGALTVSTGLVFMDELGDLTGQSPAKIRDKLKSQAVFYEEMAKARGRNRLYHAGTNRKKTIQ